HQRRPPARVIGLGRAVGDREPPGRGANRHRVRAALPTFTGSGKPKGTDPHSHYAEGGMSAARVPISKKWTSATGSALNTKPRASGSSLNPMSAAALANPGGKGLDMSNSIRE